MPDEITDKKKKTVVIVGSGVGSLIAIALAKTLDASRYSITLIAPLPYTIYLPASARMITSAEDELEKTAFLPLDRLFAPGGIGTVKQGKVVAVEADAPTKAVILEDGGRLAYDALVLATGSVWPEQLQFPDDPLRVSDHLAHWRGKIASAKSITLVGGGPVGIELAGEITEFYPEKKVTILHRGDMLLNSTYPDKFRKAFEPRLKARGVEIIFGDCFDQMPEGMYTSVKTRKGKEIETDLVLPTFGGKPNTSFLSPSLLTSGGHVKVRPTLQTTAYDDIFAAGDIIDWNERKQAAKHLRHAPVVAQNVQAVLDGSEPSAVYKGTFESIIITIGKSGGIGYLDILWGIVLGDWVVRLFSRDFMIPRARSLYNY